MVFIANLFKRLLGEKQITKEKQKQASAEGGLLSKGKKLAAQARDKLKSMVGLSKGGDKGGGMAKKAKEKEEQVSKDDNPQSTIDDQLNTILKRDGKK